ncbi:TPA: NUDIX hydrolase [Burkholderia lata]
MPAVSEYPDTTGGPVELHRNRFLSVKYDGRHHFVEYNRHRSGVVIVPRFLSGDYLMVRLARAPVIGLSLELPRGGVEPNEAPVAAAIRELLEETGYLVDLSAMRHLGQIGGDTATINSVCDVFAASISRDVPAAPFDEREITAPVRIAPDALTEVIRRGEIKDGFTLGAMTLALVNAVVRHV